VAAGSFGTAPNPFTAGLTLSFEGRATQEGQLRVTDVLGREVARRAVSVRPGPNAVPLELPGLVPGVYLLTLEMSDGRVTTRIAKE
jgi:hypothetical protein